MCRSTAKLLSVVSALLFLVSSGSAWSASCNKIGYGWDHSCAITTGGAVKCWGSNGSMIGGQLGNGSTTSSSTPVDVLTLSSGVQAVSGGSSHTCAILSTGGVKCWGVGSGGELGDGTSTFMQTSPANYVTGLSSGVQAIAAGENHTCALTTGGGVKCWGQHGSGQLGNGGAMGTGSNVPVNVSGLTSGVQKIASGGANSCALTTGGAVKCWGNDYYGQLGAGTQYAHSATPKNVVGLSSGVVDISINGYSACAVMASGGVKCWGENGNKKLGDGTSSTNSSVPVNVIGISNAVGVTVGGYHACALLNNGTVNCWGSNFSGQLGRGTITVAETPGLASGLSGVEAVAAGNYHTCAALGDGTIKCWGKGGSGQLGNGATADSASPVAVSGIACAAAVNGACGGPGACSAGSVSGDNGLTSCGTTRTWTCSGSGGGSNASCSNVNPACEPVVLGRCGAANGAPYSSAPTFGLCRSGTASAISGSGPWTWTCNGSGGGLTASCSTATMGTACKARKVSTQDGNSCVITADGGVKCWGNDYGATPATVAGLADVIDIKSSPFANCAFIKDGAIKCWGRPVGFPPTGTPQISMTPQLLSTFVSGLPSNIVDIELGLNSACVQTASGDAKCWGGNFFSQLGDGTRTDRSTPVDVQGSSGNTSKIAGGVNPTSASGCMLAKEGSVKCWGMNNNGQVGDGTTTRRDAPVSVTGLTSGVKDIVAGFASNCAVTDTGNVKCWGDPPFFDAAVPQWTPVSIAALANVTKISGGFPSTTYCALTSSGGVKCFGSDVMGALGDGGSSPNDSLLTAVDVVGLGSGVADISTARSGASATHSCAVTNAGDVKCWGGNTVSQLGTGSNSPSNTYAPVSADLCPAINGACGSADGVGVTSAPSSNLCSTGTATSVSGSGPWGWACNGSGGGTNASCSAPLKINGACGSANGVGTTSAPSSGLCSAGTASSVSGSGPFSWTCNGANGGSNASCSAPLMVNGACGSSHGGSFYSAPSSNLCTAGAASSVSGSGPYSWTCAGSNGGSTATCSAVRKVDGVCGTANGVGNENMPTALCSSGNPSGVSTVGTSWNWSCGGVNGGTNMNCAAPRIYHGLCGPANGTNVYAKPSSGLCAVGNATAVIGAGPFDWNCNGINGGNNVSCSANLTVNGQCGPAHGQFSMSAPTSGLCSAGTATAVAGTGPYTWSCNGVNGGTASACASQAIVNGKCGSSNNMPTASAPVSGLCSAGTASAVAGSGPWTWSCNGSGGGSKSSCTAPTPPPPPSFGGACPGP